MDCRIQPSRLRGTVSVPGSKSMGQRACALALLHKGTTMIRHLGKSDDDKTALRIIEELGASIEQVGSITTILSRGVLSSVKMISCGESGLSARVFTVIASLLDAKVTIIGNGSLLQRRMDFFDRYLPLLSVQIRSNNGLLPIEVCGPIIADVITVDGTESSQYISGLLMAMAYAAKKRVCLTVMNAQSKPYLDLTVSMMKQFGYDVQHESHERFIINPVQHKFPEVDINIDGDWSAAAFLLVAGALAGPVTVSNLQMDSLQADRRIIDVLRNLAIPLRIEENSIHVEPVTGFPAFQFDATDAPDLFPPLTVLAMYATGTSIINGVSRLHGKESDRAFALLDLCSRMNIEAKIENDNLYITGGVAIGARLSSHSDHRMVMAAAIAALRASSATEIEGIEAVSKSYPGFFEALQNLGARIQLSGKLQYE
jgi:3-phosphoshikimate 1-carboxyvinyltransferase